MKLNSAAAAICPLFSSILLYFLVFLTIKSFLVNCSIETEKRNQKQAVGKCLFVVSEVVDPLIGREVSVVHDVVNPLLISPVNIPVVSISFNAFPPSILQSLRYGVLK